ncbi:hypothetical protein GALMADRAFT_731298 [Galerina marginata CBS 339.88]|uniref:Uncharacterized protein n=1 Tax=Galerina marginata (strain CBS 339.88) TaxID=685588 RepID=A0A067STJ6_GALM3|nr:hypothetical protein GALMADRAFT_731298 [Galerina marginata CBS 339.88]
MRTPAQYEPHMSSYCLPATALTPTKAAGGVETHPLAARAPHMRALAQHEPHMSSCCLPAGTPTPAKDAGSVETHLLTAGAPHMRALAQHEPHMSTCCSPAGALTATKTAGGVKTQLRARRPRRWGGTVASSTITTMVNEADAGSSRTRETPAQVCTRRRAQMDVVAITPRQTRGVMALTSAGICRNVGLLQSGSRFCDIPGVFPLTKPSLMSKFRPTSLI